MCIPAPAITCVRTHHAQYQKKTNESFWYCAWCLRTHVIAGAGRHFPVLLPPSTLHTRQKVLKTEQIWTSIRGWTKSKILVRKTTRRALPLPLSCTPPLTLTFPQTPTPSDQTREGAHSAAQAALARRPTLWLLAQAQNRPSYAPKCLRCGRLVPSVINR